MTAKFIPVGEPAQDAERQALKFLVDNLPDTFVVYGNPWLVEPTGLVYEVDAVVVAPHALYVVEIKSYRGSISGNDNDWYIPQPTRSPIKLNRKTAQVLASLLRRRSVDAGRPFVEGLVFASHASDCRIVGPASADRVHTRRTIVAALKDAAGLERRQGPPPPVDDHAARIVQEILVGAPPANKPPRLVREWKLEARLERTDRYTEHLAVHRLTGQQAVLRIYDCPALDVAARKRDEELFRWEARVLQRIGQHPSVLHADAPFEDEAGYVLPFEPFTGVTLTSWIERHGPKLTGPVGIRAKVDLWKVIAEAIDAAHRQGVVHRLLRPEVILVADQPTRPDVRVAGFELAKQLYLSGQTIAISSLTDDRRRLAAPEVVRSFSDADARSDQFSLGALLGHILIGRPIFDSTEEFIRRNGAYTRLRDVNPAYKQSLDQQLQTMLAMAAANRFPTLGAAIEAVDRALAGNASLPLPVALDPENLPANVRLGEDYEVLGKLGAGGMATVYLARHLMTGATRALKVSRPDQRAEDALRAEHEALTKIDHPNIVKAIDITGVVPNRRTLVLERVKGESLAKRLRDRPITDEERRVFAEHLIAALAYLEQKGVVHKDIKPDNLIVGPDALSLIDFSLAGESADATTIGTPLYRDPALDRWSPVGDRYAAALCLFEIYVGRHAFNGQAPSPGEAPTLDDQELDRPALAEFFRKALSPVPTKRHPSALALRAALLDALGSKASPTTIPPPAPPPTDHAGSASLSVTAISGTSLACLRRAGITTQGSLVALDEAKIEALPGLGTKKREEVLALRKVLIESGVKPLDDHAAERHPLFPSLIGTEADIHTLGLPTPIGDALARAGFATIGRVADATRADLRNIPSIGDRTIAQVVQRLQRYGETSPSADAPASLDALWDLATRALQGHTRPVVDQLYGLVGDRALTPAEITEARGLPPHQISAAKQRARETIDRRVLDEVVDQIESLLVAAGGLLRIDEVTTRLCERWPYPDDFGAAGLVRLLADLSPTRFRCLPVLDQDPCDVVARPTFDEAAVEAFLQAARSLAHWPPKEPDGVRQSLQSYLPEYPLDPVGLATRLSLDLRLTEDGELFETPVELKQAAPHLLRKARLPISLADLAAAILRHFGSDVVPPPDPLLLTNVVVKLGIYTINPATGAIDVHAARGIESKPAIASDPLPIEYRSQDPAEVAGRILGSVAARDGFRLVVAPPEGHAEIARSLLHCLGPTARFVSFEGEFFRRTEGRIEDLERAERFLAQRPKLRREAEHLLDELIQQWGKPGSRIVLGDTAILGICDALHLIRRLYDATATGGHGFWAAVVPGLIHQSQPLFNEKPGAIVFSLGGTAVPLAKPLPASMAV